MKSKTATLMLGSGVKPDPCHCMCRTRAATKETLKGTVKRMEN